MAKLDDFQNKTVLITGAAGGIGSALARRLARQGAQLALVDRDVNALNTLTAQINADCEIERNGMASAFAFPCDVTRLDQAITTIDGVMKTLEHVDILINSAGYVCHRPFIEWNIDEQEHIMQVNYIGSMYFTKLLLPQMIQQQQGWICYIASAGGRIAVPDESAFAASQFALVGMAEALSIEVEDHGIHVLTMLPGSFDTPYFRDDDMARVPPVTKNNLLDVSIFVDAFFKALAKGKHEVTCPKGISTGYIVKALAPNFMRRQVKRVTLEAINSSRDT